MAERLQHILRGLHERSHHVVHERIVLDDRSEQLVGIVPHHADHLVQMRKRRCGGLQGRRAQAPTAGSPPMVVRNNAAESCRTMPIILSRCENVVVVFSRGGTSMATTMR